MIHRSLKDRGQLVHQNVPDLGGSGETLFPNPVTGPLDQLFAQIDPNVRADERIFEVIPEFGFDLGFGEQPRHLAEPCATGLRKAFIDARGSRTVLHRRIGFSRRIGVDPTT